MTQVLKCCPKCNKSPNLVTLFVSTKLSTMKALNAESYGLVYIWPLLPIFFIFLKSFFVDDDDDVGVKKLFTSTSTTRWKKSKKRNIFFSISKMQIRNTKRELFLVYIFESICTLWRVLLLSLWTNCLILHFSRKFLFSLKEIFSKIVELFQR